MDVFEKRRTLPMIPVYFIISPVENSDNSIRIRFDEIPELVQRKLSKKKLS
jgi:hypothetical protein